MSPEHIFHHVAICWIVPLKIPPNHDHIVKQSGLDLSVIIYHSIFLNLWIILILSLADCDSHFYPASINLPPNGRLSLGVRIQIARGHMELNSVFEIVSLSHS